MNIPSFKALFTSREKLVKTVQALCKKVTGLEGGGGGAGNPNGTATLNANGKVPASQLPFVNCTQEEYDTMESYDENTYYFIIKDSNG